MHGHAHAHHRTATKGRRSPRATARSRSASHSICCSSPSRRRPDCGEAHSPCSPTPRTTSATSGSLLLAWGAAVIATTRPTERRTYGLRRATILAALASTRAAPGRDWGRSPGRRSSGCSEPAPVTALDDHGGGRRRRRGQRVDRAAVRARQPRRSQPARRVPAHGGGCRRVARGAARRRRDRGHGSRCGSIRR